MALGKRGWGRKGGGGQGLAYCFGPCWGVGVGIGGRRTMLACTLCQRGRGTANRGALALLRTAAMRSPACCPGALQVWKGVAEDFGAGQQLERLLRQRRA